MNNMRACLLLALASLAIYWNSLGSDFVWDARAQLLGDPFFETPGRWLDLFSLGILSQDVLDNNRPLQLLSLLVDTRLWGKNPFGFHLTNLLLHCLCTLLVFRFCQRLLSDATHASFIGALIFAVHPINCEAVAEVSYREDLLALFFVMLALNLATHFSPKKSMVLIAVATVFSLFLAICAKESAIAGPFLLAAYWRLFRKDESRLGWSILVFFGFAVVGAFLAARFLLEPASVIFAQKPTYIGGSFLDALLTVPRIWAGYFMRVIVPVELCADYGAHSLRQISFLTGVLAVASLVCVQAVLAVNNRLFALGALIFWLSLLPVSNFIPIYRPMADRFLYLPMSGVAVMLASLLARMRPKTCIAAGTMVALLFAGLTWERQKVWRDNLTLWRDTIRKNPFSFSAAINLGTALLQANQPMEAVPMFEKALKLSNCAESQAGYAVALNAAGRTTEADHAIREAVRMDNRYKFPEKLVAALTWEPSMAAQLELIIKRNPDL